MWRAILGSLAMAGGVAVAASIGRAWRPTGPVTTRARVAILGAALCSLGLNVAVFIAFERTSIALALIAFYVYPAIVAVAAWRLYGERLDAIRIGALILASGGLLLVVLAPASTSGGLHLDPLGLALALGAACLQATYALLSARSFPTLRAPTVSTAVLGINGLILVSAFLLAGQTQALAAPFIEPRLWPWLLVGGVLGAAIPSAALLAAVRTIGPTRASILMTLEPVVGAALAALLLAEQPSPLQILGGAAVLAAAALLQVSPRDRSAAAHEVPEVPELP